MQKHHDYVVHSGILMDGHLTIGDEVACHIDEVSLMYSGFCSSVVYTIFRHCLLGG